MTVPSKLIRAKTGWGGRIRTSECRDQNPVPYHLATPQEEKSMNFRGASFIYSSASELNPDSTALLYSEIIFSSIILRVSALRG